MAEKERQMNKKVNSLSAKLKAEEEEVRSQIKPVNLYPNRKYIYGTIICWLL